MSDAPLLEVRGLNAWYGESHVLHGVDLDIREGETVTLLGRNGAGKTTTLRAIMGILRKRARASSPARAGHLSCPAPGAAQAGIGYVPEERGIFASLNVAENLHASAQGRRGRHERGGDLPAVPQPARSGAPARAPSCRAASSRCLPSRGCCAPGARSSARRADGGPCAVIVQRIGDVLVTLKQRGMTILLVEQNFRFASKVADRFYLMEDGRW